MQYSKWEEAPLSQLLTSEFSGEWGIEPGKLQYNAGVLRSTNLDDDGHLNYKTSAPRYILPSKLSAKKILLGDILLEASGGGPNKPVGRVALFNPKDNETYVCSNFFRVLRPNSKVQSSFLAWYLLYTYNQPQIWRYQQQTTGIINLKVSAYLNQKVNLPPLPEQRRIAEILDTLDEAILETERLIATLRDIKTGLLHDLLTRGLDSAGNLRDPEAHPEQFKDSPVGRIPREWNVRVLQDIATVQAGITLGRNLANSSNTLELPYLRVANVQDGFLDLSEIKYIRILNAEIERFLLKTGDVLMNEGGDYDKLGRGTVWQGEISNCIYQNHIFRVRVDRSILIPEFLSAISSSNYGKEFFRQNSKQSTNLASINSTQLKGFLIPCPSLREQQQVLSSLQNTDIRIQEEEAYRDKLKAIKKGLMEDLLTGKVRVASE